MGASGGWLTDCKWTGKHEDDVWISIACQDKQYYLLFVIVVCLYMMKETLFLLCTLVVLILFFCNVFRTH